MLIQYEHVRVIASLNLYILTQKFNKLNLDEFFFLHE